MSPANIASLILLCFSVATSQAEQSFAFKDADGQRFLPFGFYQYHVTGPLDSTLPAREAIHGMSLSSPYVSTASPDKQWWIDVGNFLDSAAAAGFKVNFQLIAFEQLDNSPEVLANLTAQIKHFKDHPAILAWYLADEPSGQGIANTTLLPKYEAVRKADPNGHPVSMVFCTTNAKDYLSMLDVIMVDPYPIPQSSASSVADALTNVASLGKAVMLVPQAFGGGENWARAPSRQEERLMTYLGLLHGAVAIQYFVRSEGIFPAPAAWGEIRAMAQEVRELTPALLGDKPVRVSVTDAATCSSVATSCVSGIAAKAWEDRDGSFVIVGASTANSDGPPCLVEFKIATVDRKPGDNCSVASMFENRYISKSVAVESDGTVTFEDSLRSLATAAYRVECPLAPAAAAPASVSSTNFVYNGGYELSVNPGVPDGNYVGNFENNGAFYFGEYRFSVAGRASLRLSAPVAGSGMTLAPYTLPKLNGSEAYTFSIWTKGAKGGETVSFAFNHDIFIVPSSNSSTYVATVTTEWTHNVLSLKSVSKPSCQYGCRSWLSYSLTSAGSVWLDELSLVRAVNVADKLQLV